MTNKPKWKVVFSNKPKGYVGISTCHGGEYDSEKEARAQMEAWIGTSTRLSATLYPPGESCFIRTRSKS